MLQQSGIPNVVRDQQRAGSVDCDTDRAAERIPVRIEEAGEHILG